MDSFEFEGRPVPFEKHDTVASALFRAGVRTFTRSLKYHRRRGLYCLSGDCPNCLISLDGVPAVRSCLTPAREAMRVEREDGWPTTETDLLSVLDHGHRLLPVGFYYKTFVHPRFAWRAVEPLIRRATGLGTLPPASGLSRSHARNVHTGVMVVGGGIAGLSAALAAAETGQSVVLCDEGWPGERLVPGPALDRIESLMADCEASADITLLERHTAVGIYEGPLVPLASGDDLVVVHPERVIVATGAVEHHGVFAGSDLPGVFLGRGAARLAGVHGVRPGDRAVVVARTAESLEHTRTLRGAGVDIEALVATDPPLGLVPDEVVPVLDGRVVSAEGSRNVRAVIVETEDGRTRIGCDALVLSLGLAPRDSLLRMAPDAAVMGAGEATTPGCSIEDAEESGRSAGAGTRGASGESSWHEDLPEQASAGYMCLCEDVSVADLEQAWEEGFRSGELLKRYTTATMGPCQGALCSPHLSCFAAERGAGRPAAARTTSRPPARPVSLRALASASFEVVEKRTALHVIHEQSGARLDWSGSWKRPYDYGNARDEYLAVRERVSVMDVSTLARFLVAGPDAATLVDHIYPCRTDDIPEGGARYSLVLGDGGYVFDDGLICALEGGGYYLTSTSGGVDHMEAWLRDRADRLGLRCHIVNRTAEFGAILVAGPGSRELLARLCDDPLDGSSLPYMSHREITVAGVGCLALRVGFVGELGFELHHSRSTSAELWNALVLGGRDLGVAPHGLDALEVLRLEKGHVYVGQDTLPDDTPAKLGMNWAVSMDKASFAGRASILRMAELPLERKLVPLAFADGRTPPRGSPLLAGSAIAGRLTSCEFSPVLGHVIGLGWVRRVDGEFPTTLRANGSEGRVVKAPFYDPKGERLRG